MSRVKIYRSKRYRKFSTKHTIRTKKRVVKSSITYHGLFNEYYFSIGEPENEKLMTTHDTVAISKNPFTGNKEYLFHIGLQ
ncbi:hypothetical protein M0811_08756 [Anaeramoeba ignava]|uniref:Uncharacterized protein n=1 Tax=Anaeramoeba ignava TaxID=1746090 RepID=A0A9Q0RBA8_ANAIG|nr:hypothetical protein M0811_08756 [Anaeramoeba ignava]